MTSSPKADLYRKLPGIDELLREPEVVAAISRDGRPAVIAAVRTVLDRLRTQIASNHLDAPAVEAAVASLSHAIEREVRRSVGYSLRPVINATGVILHTNLGRAPLAQSALEQIAHNAAGY